MEKVKEMMEKKIITPKSWGHNSVPLKQTTLLCTLMFFSVDDVWKFLKNFIHGK